MTGVIALVLALVSMAWAAVNFVRIQKASQRQERAWQALVDSGELDDMDPGLRQTLIEVHDLTYWFPRFRHREERQ